MIEQGKSRNTKEHNIRRRRRSDLLKKFSLNIDQYEEMLREQNFVCAICKNEDAHRELAVDHCHKSNKIRGLLCGECNTSLGKFKDDISILKNAISYLEREYTVPKCNDTVNLIPHEERPNWKMLVKTPKGMFPSMIHAAKFYDVHPTTMRNWCLPTKWKQEGFECEKLYVSMKQLQEYINEQNKNI